MNSQPDTAAPDSVLKQVFGFTDFRPHQKSIIEASLSGQDVFAALPTGGGKSLCYQLPALIRPGLTLVVSPLIALMKDQVEAARASGVEAGYLNSAMTPEERSEVYKSLNMRKMKLLYIAPERLAAEGSCENLAAWGCSAVAVDEAHCISEWGHEFRPEYRQISRIKQVLPGIPIMALTATATRRVQDDIISQLGLANPYIIRAGFNRPEIFYRVEPKRDTLKRIADFTAARKGRSGIIYRSTRKEVEKTAGYLRGKGIEARPYHAGLPDEIRSKNQEDFKTDKIQVIVATLAFGMGIDKPDIRFVIHGDLPRSLEAYYQETGRSGRDGDDAEVLLLWNAGDMAKTLYHINKLENRVERERAGESLRKMRLYAATFACRRKVLLAHFDEAHNGNCGGCDVCAGEVESVDATEDARKFLSAAIRTEQRYGAHYLVDILRGTLTDKIRERGHETIKTFGVGMDKSRKYWLGIADDLESGAFIYRNEERFKALGITGEGMELLYGRREFRTVRRVDGKNESIHTDTLKYISGRNRKGIEEKKLEGEDLLLFESLKALRYKKAGEIGKPPYVIFPDKTLRALAVIRPHTGEEMLECPGVGEKKLETWGELFMEAIRIFEKPPV